MNFTDICSNIVLLTKRPDKLASIRKEVNAAVLMFSKEKDYPRDMEEQPFTLPIPGYATAVPLSDLVRFRKIAYIRISNTLHYATKLDGMPSKQCDMRDKWYYSGTTLKVSLSAHANSLDIGYFQYPPVLTDAAPDYWMLDGNWETIQEQALSVIWNDIGDAQAAQYSARKALLSAAVFSGDQFREDR